MVWQGTPQSCWRDGTLCFVVDQSIPESHRRERHSYVYSVNVCRASVLCRLEAGTSSVHGTAYLTSRSSQLSRGDRDRGKTRETSSVTTEGLKPQGGCWGATATTDRAGPGGLGLPSPAEVGGEAVGGDPFIHNMECGTLIRTGILHTLCLQMREVRVEVRVVRGPFSLLGGASVPPLGTLSGTGF